MCASMVDIQRATVEIRRRKKMTEDRNHRAKYREHVRICCAGRHNKIKVQDLIMAALCNRGAIIFLPYSFFLSSIFYLSIFMVAICNGADHYIFAL